MSKALDINLDTWIEDKLNKASGVEKEYREMFALVRECFDEEGLDLKDGLIKIFKVMCKVKDQDAEVFAYKLRFEAEDLRLIVYMLVDDDNMIYRIVYQKDVDFVTSIKLT